MSSNYLTVIVLAQVAVVVKCVGSYNVCKNDCSDLHQSRFEECLFRVIFGRQCHDNCEKVNSVSKKSFSSSFDKFVDENPVFG